MMTSIPVTISMPIEVSEYLRKKFGYGRKSPYVVSLIIADMELQQGVGEINDNYARVVSELRELWFKNSGSPKTFYKAVESLKEDWSKEDHVNHSLLEDLSAIGHEKLVELVKKWMRSEGAEDVEIDELEL